MEVDLEIGNAQETTNHHTIFMYERRAETWYCSGWYFLEPMH